MPRLPRPAAPLAAVLVAAAGLASPAGASDASYRVVAKTGDPAPGGGTFDFFATPRLSATGRVGFVAYLNAEVAPSGIWSEGAAGVGSLERVVREGDPVPGLVNTYFGEFQPSFYAPTMGSNGDAAFGAELIGDQAAFGDTGVFTHNQDGLQGVALPGQLVSLECQGFCAPYLSDISNLPSINADGVLTFSARVDGAGVSDDNDSLVLIADDEGLTVAIREGDVPPNTWNVTFGGGLLSLPLINDAGEITVRNYLQHDNGEESFWTIWRGAPGGLSLVAAETWSTPAGGEFGGGLYGFGNLSCNNAGDVSFKQTAIIGPNDYQGSWLNQDGATTPLAFEGWPAPEGLIYAAPGSFTYPVVNGAGDAAYDAILAGPGIDDDNKYATIRRYANGAQAIIAQAGDQAPGLPAGVAFAGSSFNMPGMTASGRVIIHQWLEGPGVNDANNKGVWMTRPFNEPVLLIAEGQIIDVDGDPKQVEFYSFLVGSGHESGRRGGVSDLDQIAVDVHFTDGTDAIIVITPPADCPGDVNGDFFVNSEDINLVLANFGAAGDPGLTGDLDLDGVVGSADLNLVLANFGDICLPM